VYDAPEQGQDAGVNAAFFQGRLAAFYDRAQHSQYTYDGRGRTVAVARELGVPDPDGLVIGGGGGMLSRFWYRRHPGRDGCDGAHSAGELTLTLGVRDPEPGGRALEVHPGQALTERPLPVGAI